MASSDKASKMRIMAMAPVDADDFSVALKEAYPSIRFTDYDYGYVDIRKSGRIRSIPMKILHYCNSLTDPETWRFRVWLEPEEWTPHWTGPNENDVFVIPNKPTFQFIYDSSSLDVPRPDNLRPGRIWAYYKNEDKEHLRFLNRVWRIAARLTTNILDVVDEQTGDIRYPSGHTMVWAGYHALDWCRADPARRIDNTLRPADSNLVT